MGKKVRLLIICLTVLVIGTMMNTLNNILVRRNIMDINNFLQHGDFSDLKLTIYYVSPITLSQLPLSVKELRQAGVDTKITISGCNLEEHVHLIEQLGNAQLKPVTRKSRIDARLFYFFEDIRSGRRYEVAMWGDMSAFINGREVHIEPIFIEVVIPFLPQNIAERYQSSVDRIREGVN